MPINTVLCLLALIKLGSALDNGAALTPPMGWLSWERYACITDCETYPDDCINDKLYMAMADEMAANGWKEAGYEYVNIDDCWPSMKRDGANNVVADPQRFPNGIKGVCDYIHSKGLKCGLYTDIGTVTCGGYPGLNTANNMSQTKADVDAFVSWGIDSLKVDGCNADRATYPQTYPALSGVLTSYSRPILYSCSWPAYVSNDMTPEIYSALKKYCNIWRNWDDIRDSWDSVVSIIGWWASNQDMAKYAGPGSFNDPDMILVGNNGLSHTEQQVQYAMWSIFAAPLLMSNDLRSISEEAKALGQNSDMLKINQDAAGHQGLCVTGCPSGKLGEQSVWVKPLAEKGAYAVAMLNIHSGVPGVPVPMTLKPTDLDASYAGATMHLYDIFAQKDLGYVNGDFITRVGCSSVQFLRVTVASV